jgi:hypothetical protein
MRIIPTRVHGMIDYLVGLALIAAPWLFGFALGGYETWVPVCVGFLVILVSLVTRYEYSLVKAVSMAGHLSFDLVAGTFLAVSPWLLNYDEIVYAPHLIVGSAMVIISLMSVRLPVLPSARLKQDDATRHYHPSTRSI